MLNFDTFDRELQIHMTDFRIILRLLSTKSIDVLTSICKCRVRKVGSVTLYLHYSSVIATLFSELTSGTPFINVIWFGCLLRNSCVCLTYTAAVCLCIIMPMLGNFLPPCCFKITLRVLMQN